ncbi:MAG: M56 family metallopeptidase, partial [Phycisphaerales bacterium JB063]
MTGEATLLTGLFSSDTAYRLTLSLGHTLWQGVVIGAAALLLARLLRDCSAQSRHLTYMATLLAMALCLPTNLIWVAGPEQPGPAHRTAASQPDNNTAPPSDDIQPGPAVVLPPDSLTTLLPDTMSDPGADFDAADDTADLPRLTGVRDEASALTNAHPTAASNTADAQPAAPATPSRRARAWRAAASWVVPIYGLGLLLAGARLILAYRGGQRLRRLAVRAEVHAPTLVARFREQARRLGIASIPEFAVLPKDLPGRYAYVGPVVIGVLKPVVMLPAAAITQMTPAQVEAVLAHELAHIKRYDPWLMLFQRAAETLLFFHPMVWLISRLASVEREHACDDLAINAGAQPGHYAEALLHFAKRQADLGSKAPRTLAAAALAMAQRSAQGKALENRLARLFGRRIPNPLRLTRKGLLSLILVGLVGLTTLITTTRAQPPDPYFTQAEIIPALAYPDPTAAPHPPLAMQVKFVRPMHTSVLFTPDGDPVEETWMDYTGSHNYGRDDDLLRDILIELPDDCPPLTFAPTGCRMEVPGGVVGLGSCRPELCYRADGTPYILIREHFRHHHLGHQPRIDLTLAYFVGDERGDAEAAFTGPFLSGRSVTDPSRMYRITTTITRKHNAGPDDWSATIELPKALDPMDASVMDSYLIAYDKWGRAFTLENLSYRDLPLGRGEMTFVLEGHDGPGLEDVARLALNETPRTTTFRNIVVDWEGWTDREESYPPYIDAMAAHLGWPVETEADREAILHSDLTVEEALVVVDVAQNYAATRVWRTLRDAEPRLTYDDLTAQEQARVLAAATNWIDASDPQVQRAGLEMGLWSGDMRFWAPAVAHIRRKGYRASGVLYDLSRQLAGQMQAGHFNDLITLVDTAESAGDIDGVMAAFRLTGSHVQPTQRRKATVDALVELARHDDPWVWYAAINRIHENSHTLHDADHQPARETVLPRLAAESDEMLRRCAIVVPDADALGRPLPPRETLRLEPLFTPAMWRMLRIGDFFDLYDQWVTDDPVDLDQWDRVVGFLDQLDDEWSLSRGDGWSLDNSVIVHRVVQHLNAVFDQDLGGLGQVRTETASRVGNDKAYRRIAREAVAWYHGVEGPAKDRQAEGVEVDRADLIGTWRLNDEDSAVPYTDAAGLDPGSHGSMETAEAFIAALLTARVGDAEALTHTMDERRCGRFAGLALLDIGDDFGATAVYRDLRDRDDHDEDEAGEAADGDDNAGGGTIGVVFAPIDVPAELADQGEAQRMALIVEVQRVDGLWRVTGIDAEELGEDFYAQVQQAHDTGRIEIIPHEAKPLPPRIVGYRDPKPLDLHRAIMAGDLERVEALLEAHPAWVHARLAIEGNNTPLHTAVTQACWSYNKTEQDGRRGVALFGLLLDHGADINATNADGRTVLSAFCGGYAPTGRSQPEAGMAALRLLIEHGADVHHADDDGRTPLYSLALSSLGHRQTAHEPIADAAELLLEAGADPELGVDPGRRSDDRLRTPMHVAIYSRNPHLLAVLLEHGADPSGPNMQAFPPLHALAVARANNNTSDAEYKAVLERDTLACARLLVEHGADPWTRVLSDRISTTGAINHRGMECTAWDWAPDGAMREYLGELMAPRRAELEAEARAIGERFVRAALAGDAEAMRADTAEVFVLHDPQPTERMLPHVAELLRGELDVDLDDDDAELPVVAVTGRLREGGVLLRNKEGAELAYTAVLTIHDGERWRVIGLRQTPHDNAMGALRGLFGFRQESIGYVRYQTTGELPAAFGGSRTGAVHRAEFAVVGLDDAGRMTMQWHGRGRHIATTQLTRAD